MKKLFLIWILIFACLLTAGCDAMRVPLNGAQETEDHTETGVSGSAASERESTASESDRETLQSADTESVQEQPDAFWRTRPYHGLGTNDILEGDRQVHLFFIDDNESQWDEASIEAFTQKQILLGLDFLEDEAQRYGISLNFSIKKYATVFDEGYELHYDGIIKDGDNGSHTLDLHKCAARALGYENEVELHDELYMKNGYCEVVFLFLVNKDGVAYAFQQAEGSRFYPIVEYATVFVNYLDRDFDLDEITHAAASVAHEILHLYGAADLYEPYERKNTARMLYPEDIMLLDYLNVDEMNLGEFTAYSVGWRSHAPTHVGA